MLDTARAKVAAAAGMAACCGLSMAIAVGLIAVTSAWLISGFAVAGLVACSVIMLRMGHTHGQHHHHETIDDEAETGHRTDGESAVISG